MNQVEARAAVRAAIEANFGSQAEYARQRGCSTAYVCACLSGIKAIPDDMLTLAGIERVTEYRPLAAAASVKEGAK